MDKEKTIEMSEAVNESLSEIERLIDEGDKTGEMHIIAALAQVLSHICDLESRLFDLEAERKQIKEACESK